MILRIEEAIARAKTRGIQLTKKQIAEKLFPAAQHSAQQVNMTNLINGRTTRIKPEWVIIICKMCGCSADFLFGLKNE